MIRVGDIMTPNPKTLSPTHSISTAMRLMLDGGFHHIPIVEEGRLVGIVHANHIRQGLGMVTLPEIAPTSPNMWESIPLRTVMAEAHHVVTPNTSIADLIELMRRHALTGVPVMEGERLVGIVTITDVLDMTREFIRLLVERPTPPAVAFVGKAGSGKTTLIEQLIPVFHARGYRVGVVKHHHRPTWVDQEGKDTWRYARAGASPVSIVSQIQTALFIQTDHELPLDFVLARYFGSVDIVLIEGYRWSDKPKIEVHRQARSDTLLCSPDELTALVSDQPWPIPCPQFQPHQIEEIATFIETSILKANSAD